MNISSFRVERARLPEETTPPLHLRPTPIASLLSATSSHPIPSHPPLALAHALALHRQPAHQSSRPLAVLTPLPSHRFNPPSLSPSNSLLGQVAVGSSFTSSSWQGQQGQNSTGDAADPLGVDLGVGLALTIGPQESAADRSLLQGPGRPQRRRGNSLTEGGVGAAAAGGWQQHQQWVLDGSGQAQEKGPFVPLLTPSTSANSLVGAVDGGEAVFSALSAGIVKGLAPQQPQQQQRQQSNSPPRPLQVPQPVRLTAAPSQPQPQPQPQQQQTKLVQPQAQRIASIFPRREEDRSGDA